MAKILDNLYVAGAEETYEADLKSKVTHFLNVASEVIIHERVDHGYKKIGINDDDNNCDIRTILSDCIVHIHNVLCDGGSICVHCLEGKSRSVCVCIAYMCCKLGWDFDEAYNHVKKQRPCIDIYPLYYEQLCEYVKNIMVI
jgi:protein-tyrosine phosphatase